MVISCSAPGCTRRYSKDSGTSFYRFPKDADRLKKWQVAMKRMKLDDPTQLWIPSEHDRICNAHFVTGIHWLNLYFLFNPIRQHNL